MNQIELPQANQPQVGFKSGSSKKHVSYNKHEDYIGDIEIKLMKKYRCGYSALHKMLVVKEGRQQFSGFYL